MKLIKLSQNKFAQVDDEDFEIVNKHKWSLKKNEKSNTYYAIRSYPKTVYLHRFIMKVYDKSIWIDHKDRNGLNCQKSNLRISTPSQNCMNRQPKKNGSSKYLGVHKSKVLNKKLNKYYIKYVACIVLDGIQEEIGRFNDEIDAAKAYDKIALKHHKEFANLNFK